MKARGSQLFCYVWQMMWCTVDHELLLHHTLVQVHFDFICPKNLVPSLHKTLLKCIF